MLAARSRFVLFSTLVLGLLTAVPASAVQPRVVLLESFTSSTCSPCAFANPVTRNLVEDNQHVVMVNVQYHMSWPSPGDDPMYLANTSENDSRRGYYGINAIPDLVFDGKNVGNPGDYRHMEKRMRKKLVVDPTFEIFLGTTTVGNQITISADVTALQNYTTGNLRVRMAVVEPVKSYGTAPGSNGETVFYSIMRDMVPGALGTAVAPALGATVNVTEVATLDPSWVDPYVVVWVQDESTKNVLQTATTLDIPNAFYFGADETAQLGNWDQLYSLETTIDNYGQVADTYDVHIEKDLPANWTGSVCHEETCFAPFVTDFQVTLGPHESERIYCDMVATTDIAQGTFTLTATSQNDPSIVFEKQFKLISPDVPVLIMDNDGFAPYEQYAMAALEDAGQVYAVWDHEFDDRLTNVDLNRFDAVVWNTGRMNPALLSDDRGYLDSYLAAGGKLLINGQDLAWNVFSALGSAYSTTNQTFFRNRLGAILDAGDSADHDIVGVAADPVFGGLSFSIAGGDGAMNQLAPDQLSTFGTGIAGLEYGSGSVAGIYNDGGSFKTVTLGFGFEGISTAADRAAVMGRAMEFFGLVPTGVGEETPQRARLIGEPSNFPNPFNPSTSVSFEIQGQGEVPVSVDILDVRGRRVRNLPLGELSSGTHRVEWNGRDQDGVLASSGVYFARVDVGGVRHSIKMALTK